MQEGKDAGSPAGNVQQEKEKPLSVYNIVLEDPDGDYGYKEVLSKTPLVLTAANKYEVYELLALKVFKSDWADHLAQHEKAMDDKHQIQVRHPGDAGSFDWISSKRDPNYRGPAVEQCPYVDVAAPHYSKMEWGTTRHAACRLAHLCGFRVFGSQASEVFDLEKTLAGVDLSALLELSRKGFVTGEMFELACTITPFHVKRLHPLQRASALTQSYVSTAGK
jgi:hypothetical protein